MFVSITSIELKSPLNFFQLSLYALNIVRQLKSSKCVEFKKRGIWTKHYTMTLWENKSDMMEFAKSGAHLTAMKKSSSIAKEIRLLTLEADILPAWKEAKIMLKKNGRCLKF